MLLSLSRPAIRLLPPASGRFAGEADPVIEAMVNLMPDYSSGVRLHDLYVNRLQGALPGNFSQLFGTGPAFRAIFYPSWGWAAGSEAVASTGLDDRWWSDFSVAVLCQAIAEMAGDLRRQMLGDKISAAIGSYNATLRSRSAVAYSRVLATTYPPLVALLGQVDRTTAKQRFRDSLLANVVNRQLWYQAGVWTSPDWEIFNQYAKYLALGATEAEVDTLITDLLAAGLPVPPQVQVATWRGYADEFRERPNLDLNDIRSACADGVNQRTYIPNYSGRGMPTYMPNGNCYEFTANSQPGNPYRGSPASSCFTGATQVLLADGAPVALRDLRRGDRVLTRDGAATVGYVSTAARAGRPLHRLDGGGPVFTESHPFRNAAARVDPPRLLSMRPGALGLTVPTLTDDGIGHLGPGSDLFVRGAGPDAAVATHRVSRIEVLPDSDDDFLYDVQLAPGAGRAQEFWAGTGDRFVLVAPEFPVIARAGAAAVTLVAMMEGLLVSGGPEGDGWPEWVAEAAHRLGPGLFLTALQQALATTPSFGAPEPAAPLDARIDVLYAGLSEAPPGLGAVVSAVFDSTLAAVGQWLTSLIATGWRGGTNLGGDVVALTVFDLALAPTNPIPAASTARLEVRVLGREVSGSTTMWDRSGRGNTRFHHYYDQVVHAALDGDERPTGLDFAVYLDQAAIPCLAGELPLLPLDVSHALQAVPLRDASGAVAGELRFDTRRIGRDAAVAELGACGLWTEAAQAAYANAIGASMVAPMLWKLREVAPVTR